MGVFDVDRLARELETLDEKTRVHDFKTREKIGFKIGFNKAMELNKDKVFTVEDVKKIVEMSRDIKYVTFSIDELISSIQQPTEIEVEIEMENVKYFRMAQRPKLDSSGNLILKKK
jgi:hypothetical protein